MATWIELMGWGTRFILVLLLLLSIWSVAIMFDRRAAFKSILGPVQPEEAKRQISSKNWSAVKAWAESSQGLYSEVVLAALSESKGAQSESIDRAVQSYLSEQKVKLEKGLHILATLASNAPFIGLLGTVLGIIQSFGILSNQSGSAMSTVMFGLAEALITTAVGLFVAIPAGVAYNAFSNKIRTVYLNSGSIRDLYISKLER